MGNRAQKQRKSTTEYVDVVNSDELAAMSDEELIARRQELDIRRDRLLKAHADCVSLEVELAYIQREFQLRHARHEIHGDYAHRVANEIRDEMCKEDSLPNVDFSNIEFVRLHMEYKHNQSNNKRARC